MEGFFYTTTFLCKPEGFLYIYQQLFTLSPVPMLKKLIRGVVLWLVAVGLIYLYFLYAGNPSIMRTWIQAHQLYTAIFFCSAVAGYMLQWDNKFFKFILFVLIIINLYCLGDLFFKNNIGLNSSQFITLFVLMLIWLSVIYITHRVRYILGAIVVLGSIFVLMTGTLPLYENIPNITEFIQSQKTKIINQWANTDGILTIKNALGTKKIPIKDLQESDIDLSQKTQISYASKIQSQWEKIFIDLGNWTFINIQPQSAVTLEQSGDNTIMQIIQGNVEYYTPKELSWVLQIIGKYKGKSIEETKNNIREQLTKQYEQKKEEFFVNQIGGTIVLNPVVDKVIGFFINTLYSINPTTYQKNLTNYNNIQWYFGKTTTWNTNPTTGETISSIFGDLMGQIKKWAEETSMSQRLK